jgi:pimeloyl-ACP methyl ester carboxylesterase
LAKASSVHNAMADDAIRILDVYRIRQAHLVGMSLGGMIEQLAAWRIRCGLHR